MAVGFVSLSSFLSVPSSLSLSLLHDRLTLADLLPFLDRIVEGINRRYESCGLEGSSRAACESRKQTAAAKSSHGMLIKLQLEGRKQQEESERQGGGDSDPEVNLNPKP